MQTLSTKAAKTEKSLNDMQIYHYAFPTHHTAKKISYDIFIRFALCFAFKTEQLRSVIGMFLRPNYLQILWLKYFMKLLQRNKRVVNKT